MSQEQKGVTLHWPNGAYIVLTDADLTTLLRQFGPPTRANFWTRDSDYNDVDSKWRELTESQAEPSRTDDKSG